ncbi:MAG: hypothetical protein AAFX87_07015 [Bacteroidota bacterium]
MSAPTITEEKQELENSSQKNKEKFEEEVALILKKAEGVSKNALVIGGTMIFAYHVVKQLMDDQKKPQGKGKDQNGKKKKAEPEPAGISNSIFSAVLDQATIFLLTIAKDKLVEYLDELNNKNNADIQGSSGEE